MTIHTDWARLLRAECPEAFYTDVPQGVPLNVGIIDGHLQLMCLHAGFCSWEVFVHALYARPIARMLEAGCTTVVVCFDCYDHVPVYKAMTQQKRAQAHAPCKFEAGETLPPSIPQEAMPFLMNRNFKLRVVEYVCATLPEQVTLAKGQKLVIDYKRVIEYAGPTCAAAMGVTVPDMEAMGESDVKYMRYVQRFGNALVHASDGDYMTIALLFYAREGRSDTNRIFLYRQGTGMSEEEDGDDEEGTPPKKKKKSNSGPSKKCWVDMQLLYVMLAHRIGCADGAGVEAFVKLMLCAGTDFSRGLPLLGPKRLWEHLPMYTSALLGHDGVSPEIVDILYGAVFAKHARNRHAPALPQIRASPKLAQSTLQRIPSNAQVETTLRNVGWVICYWTTYNGNVETPLDGSHGFVRCPATGQVRFMDLLA